MTRKVFLTLILASFMLVEPTLAGKQDSFTFETVKGFQDLIKVDGSYHTIRPVKEAFLKKNNLTVSVFAMGEYVVSKKDVKLAIKEDLNGTFVLLGNKVGVDRSFLGEYRMPILDGIVIFVRNTELETKWKRILATSSNNEFLPRDVLPEIR